MTSRLNGGFAPVPTGRAARPIAVLIAVAVSGALAGCAPAATHTNRSHPGGGSDSPTPVAEMARGAQGSRASIPWGKVGAGWILAEWTATSPSSAGGPPGAAPSSSPVDLFLVDPVGGRYLVATLPPSSPGLQAWSGDGHRALLYGSAGGAQGKTTVTELNLEQGSSSQVALPTGTGTFTRPHGTALLWLSGLFGPSPPAIQRFDLQGNLQLTFPNRFSNLGAATGSAAYSPDGTELAIGAQNGVAIVYNNGRVLRQVAVPGALDCAALRWQSASVLASCRGSSYAPRLWWIPTSGAPATALTGPPVAPDLGDLNAWAVGATTFVQDAGGCGYLYLAALQPGGTTKPVVVPGVPKDNSVVVLGADGGSLALRTTIACATGRSAVWFTPATNATDVVLGPGLNGGSVLSALLFGQ